MCRYGLIVLFFVLVLPLRAMAQETHITIVIEGVDSELETNIRNLLGIERIKEQENADPNRVRSSHRRAVEEIERALQPFGYYSPTVIDRLVEEGDNWVATYTIELGEPVLIRDVQVLITGPGEDDPELARRNQHSKLLPGLPIDHRAYEELKANMFRSALARGYLDATFVENTLEILVEERAATIRLTLDSGPQYRFGTVTVDQEILDPEFVARFNQIQYGDVFDSAQILDLKLALTQSGYFSSVESDVLKDEAVDYHVPVVLTARPSKPVKYLFGVGYGTDIGPRVSAGARLRQLNRKGHQLNTRISLSRIEPSLSAQYAIPIRNVRRDQFSINASVSDQEYARGDGQSEQYEVGISQNVELKNWTRRLYLKARYDNYFIGTDTGISTLVMPGMSLNRLRADDTLYTRKGYSIALDVHGSSSDALSDQTFINGRAAVKWVRGLTSKSRLLVRGQVGAVEADNFSELPPAERYFSGGDQSVRGYAYQDISPRDEQGNRIGGKYMYAGSVEFDHLFYQDYGGAVFVDIGTATNDIDLKPRKGVGFGIRWASPVGMARVDLAWPLDGDSSKVRLHISIGPDL